LVGIARNKAVVVQPASARALSTVLRWAPRTSARILRRVARKECQARAGG
jgi:hypothetical protein